MFSIFDFLQSIPNIIWSGLIASAVTFSGVLISDRSNTRRLIRQLKHDTEKTEKERHIGLKREIFLVAIEESTKAISCLTNLPQADFTKSNPLESLQSFSIAFAKLQLVAESQTAALASNLVSEISALALDLAAKVMPVQKAKVSIAIHDELYNDSLAETKRLNSEISKQNESGQPNEQAVAFLQRSWNFAMAQMKTNAQKRDEAWREFNRLQAIFLNDLVQNLRKISRLQIPVLVEIRRELGFTTDTSALYEQMENNLSRMTIQFKKTISDIGSSNP